MTAFFHRHYLCGMDEHGFDCSSPKCERDIQRGKEIQELLRIVIQESNENDKKVLTVRFGDTERHTLEEIAETFGMTCEEIREVEKRALKKVEKMLSIDSLKG